MKKEKLTLKNKIDLIMAHTTFTSDELLNLPTEVFDKIFTDVNTLKQATDIVDVDVFLYKKIFVEPLTNE